MMINLSKLIVITLILGLCACKTSKNVIQIKSADITTMDQVKADIRFLASDELEGREVGTEGERKAASYIAQRLTDLGIPGATLSDNPYYQYFEKRVKSNPHALEASPDDKVVSGRNVVAFDDNGSKYTIAIGAHYDHLGYGAEGSLYTGPPALHNGADDNASGVSAMLAIAEYLKDLPLNSNLLFIAFSGEEKGLWGSNYFVDHSPTKLEDYNFMINMDMIGRLNEDRQLAIYGTGTSPVWDNMIESIKQPYFKFKKEASGVGPSDHTSFYLEDIPVLQFFTGQHEDYHRPTDDHEKLNYEGLEDVIEYITTLIIKTDNTGKIKFTKTVDESQEVPDFKVTLGVIPDYLFDGRGMRIDGVRENRPAANAGLEKGDVVIQMGDLEIVDMMSYMKALGAFEKGQTIKIKVKRDDDKVVEKDLTF